MIALSSEAITIYTPYISVDGKSAIIIFLY